MVHATGRKLAAHLVLLFFALSVNAQEQAGLTEFDKMLLGLPYDRQMLLDEVQALDETEAGGD